ncbi:MAG: hypothetical protein ACK5NG_07795 [Chthoniobacterales bacterium]
MSSEWIQDDEHLNEAFRLSFLLCEDREAALNILKTALNKLARYSEKSNPQRALRFLLFEIRRQCLAQNKISQKILRDEKKLPGDSTALSALPSDQTVALLRALPDPARSVAALFYAAKQPVSEIAHILSLSENQVAAEMDLVRQTLRTEATRTQ